MDATDFLKFVLDRERLAVVGLAAAGPRTVEELATTTGQRERAVLGTLGPLVQAGIVERDGERYKLRADALRELARELPQPAPPDRRVLLGMTEDEQAVLGRFFRGERLVELPVTRAKRRIVLERLALEFEPGIRYPETEVNETLTRFHDDYASLRRHLVDEGFLDRDRGVYWRAGGRVE